MKYIYTFKEINYGSVEIDTSIPPDNGEIIEAIMDGKASFKNTDYEDIKLDETE